MVPADDGLGPYDEEDLAPARTEIAEMVQKSRSRELNAGRRRWRLSTASCCRSARTSRAVSLRLRKKTPMALMKERMSSNTNSPLYHGVDVAFPAAGTVRARC